MSILNNKSVLLADDESIQIDSLRRWFLTHGYRVFPATSGAEALRIFTDKPNDIDLILADYLMPGMTGLQLLQEIRRKDPLLPVIIMTAYADKDMAVTALRNRCVGFLEKPFTPVELQQELDRVQEVVVTELHNWGRKNLEAISNLALLPSDSSNYQEISTLLKINQQWLQQVHKMTMMGTLAGGIIHDFRNMLHVVQGYVNLLLLDMDQKQCQYDDLKELAAIARQGIELSHNFLKLGHQAEEEPQSVALNRTIKRVTAFLNKTFPQTIHIASTLETDLNSIQVIPTIVEQLLFNLCINARDAMPNGGKLLLATENVTVSPEDCLAMKEASPGDYVKLTVTDTGCGMAPEVLARIYEPLYTTKEPGRGTGLGLAMVLLSVKKYQGFIHCDSKPGVGTSFQVFLPAIKTEPSPPPGKTAEKDLVGGHETILLVDDEEGIRHICQRMLKKFGYTVLTAGCGEEALELFRQEQDNIDLIILDRSMPGMDGFSCLKALHQLDNQARVIISSGQVENFAAPSDAMTGARAYLHKPYSLTTLLSTVRTVLDQQQSGAGSNASTVTSAEGSGQAEKTLS